MQVRSLVLAGVLVLLAPAAIATAQDATFAAQDEDPEGVVLPGEDGSGSSGSEGGGESSGGGSASPQDDASPGAQDDTADDGADRSAASGGGGSAGEMPQTGGEVTPLILLGLMMILAGVMLRQRTVPLRTRRW
jgi:LPXTG-motif cell wall-anchored protein